VTLDQVRKASYFKDRNVSVSDGVVYVRLAGNKTMRIEGVVGADGNVSVHLGILTKTDGTSGGLAAGKFEGHTITLSGIADKDTLNHEVAHAAEELGFISKPEIRAINRAIERETGKPPGSGTAAKEARAKWIENRLKARRSERQTWFGRIIQRLRDFINGIISLFRTTGNKVVRDIESGRIFDRTEEAAPDAFSAQKKAHTGPLYQVKPGEAAGYGEAPKDPRLGPMPHDKDFAPGIPGELPRGKGLRALYQKHVGDPIWLYLTSVPEVLGRRSRIIDAINRGLILDYRKDPEYIMIRDETEKRIREAREKAKELARIINTFPPAEQLRIGQIIEGSVTVTPKRYEVALKVAKEFRQLEKELQDLGILGPDNRFRQLTRAEIAKKFDEIKKIDQKIQKLETELAPIIKEEKSRTERVVSEITEKIIENSDDISDADIQTRAHKAVKLNESRVKEALLARGFSPGEADQMIARIKQSVIKPDKGVKTGKDAGGKNAVVREIIRKSVEKVVSEKVIKTKTYSRTRMARARGSIIRDINKLKKERSEILGRIQTHYKMSGKQYLYLAYKRVEDEKKFLTNFRRWVKKARLRKGYDIRRKDLPDEWRKLKNRLPTPQLVLKGLSAESHDAELMRHFVRIAKNNRWAVGPGDMDAAAEENPDIDYSGFKPLPQSDKLGPLSGMLVDPYIWDDLNQAVEVRTALIKAWDGFLRFWKTTRVVWSMAAQARNIMSGFILADMGDLPYHRVDIYARTAKEMIQKGPMWKEAYKTGLLGTEWAGTEIASFLDEAAKLNEKNGNILSQSFTLLRKLGDLPSKTYQGIEQFFKLAVYIHGRERGLSVRQAAAHSEKYTFNYQKIPPAIRWAKRWYSPFITFVYKALPRFAETAIRKPWKIIKMMIVLAAVEEITRRMRGESEEMVQWEKRILPAWMRRDILPGQLAFLRIPVTDKYGRAKYIDLSYILPWGDIGEQWGQSSISYIPRSFLPSHPLYIVPAEIAFNEILFTGEPLDKDWYTKTDYAKALGKEIWRQFMPSIAGGYQWNTLMAAAKGEKDWAGREMSLTEAVFNVFLGIKIKSIDYTEAYERALMHKQRQIQDIEYEFSREYRRINIQASDEDPETQREKNRELFEKYNKRLDRILDQVTGLKKP